MITREWKKNNTIINKKNKEYSSLDDRFANKSASMMHPPDSEVIIIKEISWFFFLQESSK